MSYKNMKIEINKSQPLDEVVKELERLGYKRNFFDIRGCDSIHTMWSEYHHANVYVNFTKVNNWGGELTTLAELKEM